MDTMPTGIVDRRFSEPDAEAAIWPDVERYLADAELFWITTVRADGRPHVTPLHGVRHDGARHFCTGEDEQKAHNLRVHDRVALTTGTNAWAEGLDVVVEGQATRVRERASLEALATLWGDKYGEEWRYEVGDGHFATSQSRALVFRVEAAKVLAFAKAPFAQTTFRPAG